jgi:hypothetical protein
LIVIGACVASVDFDFAALINFKAGHLVTGSLSGLYRPLDVGRSECAWLGTHGRKILSMRLILGNCTKQP